MKQEEKIKITFFNQINNLSSLIVTLILYYCPLLFVNKDFLKLGYFHILPILLTIPTFCIHTLYLLENHGKEYSINETYINDKTNNINYSNESILKIEVHKYGNLPNGNFSLPFHSYKFCKVILKDGKSFIITSLMKPNIDEFLKQKLKGVVFDRHYDYFL